MGSCRHGIVAVLCPGVHTIGAVPVGSAHAALESGFVSRKTNLVQECGAGLIELSVESDGRIFLRGPQAKVEPLDKQIPSIFSTRLAGASGLWPHGLACPAPRLVPMARNGRPGIATVRDIS